MPNKMKSAETKSEGGGKNFRAFTLIEVLVALAIAAGAVIVVSYLFVKAISLNRELRTNQFALKVAQNKIEELRRKPYPEVALLQNPPGVDTDLPCEAITGLKNGQLCLSIYNYDGDDGDGGGGGDDDGDDDDDDDGDGDGDGNEDSDIKKIKVEVKWTGSGGENKNYPIYTLMAKRGLND